MIDATHLAQLNAQQLRETVLSLIGTMASQTAEIERKASEIERKDREIAFKQAVIDKITHEMAVLKRLKFAARSEAFNAEQKSLLDETIDADMEALQRELDALQPPAKDEGEKQQPRRQALPENLPRREIHHEPHSTTCACGCQLKRIGQDVAEKLDYQPGVFTVERHIRGKWVCAQCETLIQAPVPAHVIDKGLPTTGLLAQVLVAKYADHLPLYRQEAIFGRAGVALPRSTLAQWVGACGVQLQPLVLALRAELLRHDVLHADETPVAMLKPGNGKTHRAYLWSYCTTTYNPTRAVVFDFADSRGGQHCRAFLGLPGQDGWHGSLVCEDFSGYKACFEMGVSEGGCLAHARRKFHELWVSHQSTIGEQALKFFIQLYEVERQVHQLDAGERKRIRQERGRPVADALRRVVDLRGALLQPFAVGIQLAGADAAAIRLPPRLLQAAANRLAVQLKLARDGRDALAPRASCMNLFPLLLTEHWCLRVHPEHGHGSRGADQGPVALVGGIPRLARINSNFHFYRLLLGIDGWGKFDDHNWGLLEDH